MSPLDIDTNALSKLPANEAASRVQQQIGNNIGALHPVTTNAESGEQQLVSAQGYPAIASANGGYKVQVARAYDAAGEGGQYGAMFADVDAQGNVQKVYHESVPRGSTTLLERMMPYIVSAIIAYAGAGAAGLVSAPGAGTTAAELASADAGMMGFGGSGAAVTPTVEGITAAASAGATPASLTSAITNLVRTAGPGVLQALKAIPGLSNVVDQVANTLTGNGGSGMLNNLLNIGAGAAQLQGLKDASNTAAQGYQDLGNDVKGQYQFLGAKGQGMFNDLGAQGKAGYENLGMKVGDTYNNLATQTEGQYANLAARTKADVGKFTPYNITTNVGSTDSAGKFTPTAGSQGISDAATQAATSSFGAANGIDVNNLTKQRYDLMQSIFAPGDAQSLAAIQAQQQARGRTGLQSLNPATEMGGVGSNPAMVAYYKAQQDRNLKAQSTAADQALAQRGGLLSQGTQAAGVPLQIAQQGTNQLQLGSQMGNTAFNAGLQGAQLGSGIEQRGLDQGTNFRGTGAGAVTGLFKSGLDYGLNAQQQGIKTNLDYSAQGINDSTPQYVRAIGQKYEGNKAATNALFSLLSAIARGTGQAAPTSSGSATQTIGQLTNMLQNAGVSDAQIQQIIQSQVNTADPYTSNDYQDNADTVNSIWGPSNTGGAGEAWVNF